MSRIGKQPVELPDGVSARVTGSTGIEVEGPNGKLREEFTPEVELSVEDGAVIVKRLSNSKRARSLHGLTRSLIANMVEGVTEGFEKTLEINGVGYSAEQQGNELVLEIGFSHPVELEIPPQIDVEIISRVKFKISGPDKQQVGQFAANIRKVRPPEPYNAKGIKYEDERIRRKQGKAFGTGVA